MRTRLAAGALGATLALAGCGSAPHGSATTVRSASRSKARTRAPIKILTPANGLITPADHVVVTGTAAPGENLQYLDHSGVQGLQTLSAGPDGGWTVTVLLSPGPNWIDFLAGHRSATLWVTRQ